MILARTLVVVLSAMFLAGTPFAQKQRVKKNKWIIERTGQAALMTLDVPYKHNKKTDHMVIVLSKRSGEQRPDVVSVMVPEPVKKENGMYMVFARATNKNGKVMIERDTGTTGNASFTDCNSEFCTVRLDKGYLKGRSKLTTYDVINFFMTFDEVTFLYFDSTSYQSISVPLASFKKQYKELP